MRSLRNLPIRRKLTFITMVTSGVALVLASIAFVAYEQIAFRRTMMRDLSITAQMIGFNFEAALSFNDPGLASQMLKGLSAHPHIVAACVYDSKGGIFASYSPRETGRKIWPSPEGDRAQFHADSLEVFRKINFAGETIGVVYIQSDLEEMHALLQRYAIIGGALLVGCLLVAFLLASRLQKIISEPIIDLSNIATQVATEKNYSLRAVKRNEDEIGHLIDGFNEMLSQIQTRDSALRGARDELERRVVERTRDLQLEVTERQRADADLANERYLMQSLMDHVPDSIYFKDRESRFLKCSEFLAVKLGLKSGAEVVGKTDFDFFNEEDARAFFKDEQEIIRTGQSVVNKSERKTWKSTGQTIWTLTTKMPLLNPAGEIIGTFGLAKDITEQKIREEELRRTQAFLNSVVENLPMGVFIKEAKELRYALWSNGNAELVGLSRVETMGKSDYDLYPKEQADSFRAKDRETLAQGNRVSFSDETVQTRYHGKRDILTRKVSIMDENGQPAYLLGISEDITERKQTEEQLKETHKQLLAVSRQAGMAEVATSVLHNVGNVLNSVNVSSTLVAEQVRQSKVANLAKVCALLQDHEHDLADFLTHDAKGKQVPGYLNALVKHLGGEQSQMLVELDSLRKNVEHIKDIVFMQQSYAKVSGVTERLKIADLIEDALRMNADSLGRHDVKVALEFDPHLPEILIDKSKVLQILVNLIRNAKHACDDSAREDKQMILRVVNGEKTIRISVVDNGIGIPAENLTRIFNHGFTTRQNGHGFGLHSGALAARELGGSLNAFSDGLGHGAVFTLELPANDPEMHHE